MSDSEDSELEDRTLTKVLSPRQNSLLEITNEYMTHLEDEIWEYISGLGQCKLGKEILTRENAFNNKTAEELEQLIDAIKTRAREMGYGSSAMHSIEILQQKYRVMLEIRSELGTNGADADLATVLTDKRKQVLSQHQDSALSRSFSAVFAFLTLVSLPFVWARTGNFFGSLFTSRGEKFCDDMQKAGMGSPASSNKMSFGK